MQAIITKVIPATNFKTTRIKAICERGSVIISAIDLSEDAHELAAKVLCIRFADEDEKKYETPPNNNPWLRPFVTGQLPSGDYVHVFTS